MSPSATPPRTFGVAPQKPGASSEWVAAPVVAHLLGEHVDVIRVLMAAGNFKTAARGSQTGEWYIRWSEYDSLMAPPRPRSVDAIGALGDLVDDFLGGRP